MSPWWSAQFSAHPRQVALSDRSGVALLDVRVSGAALSRASVTSSVLWRSSGVACPSGVSSGVHWGHVRLAPNVASQDHIWAMSQGRINAQYCIQPRRHYGVPSIQVVSG